MRAHNAARFMKEVDIVIALAFCSSFTFSKAGAQFLYDL